MVFGGIDSFIGSNQSIVFEGKMRSPTESRKT